MGSSNQYLWFCVFILWQEHRKAQQKVFLEEPGIKPVIHFLQGITLIHYTTAASKNVGHW